MKLAIVSPFPPSKGTLNEYALHLVEQFKKKEEIERIDILSDQLPEGEYYEQSEKVNIKALWKFNSLLNPFRILKELLILKPDVVLFNIHFMSFGDKKVAAALGLLIPFFARLMGIKSVVLLHNIIESVDLSSAGFAKNIFFKKIYQLIGNVLTRFVLRADKVAVTISTYVDILEKKYKAKNVCLIPHGTFEVPLEYDATTEQSKKRILTFGKFGTYKKVDELIKAFDIVQNQSEENLELVIAGSDSPNCHGYLDRMKEKYAHVSNVHYTGYVAEEDIPELFSNSAMVVFPYTSTTGSSGVLHQAGSYRCAAVLPNIGDLKSLVEEEGYRGEYFKAGDAQSLGGAIGELLSNPSKRERLAKANFLAARALPMADIADWYLAHFWSMAFGKVGGSLVKSFGNKGKAQQERQETVVLKSVA